MNNIIVASPEKVENDFTIPIFTKKLIMFLVPMWFLFIGIIIGSIYGIFDLQKIELNKDIITVICVVYALIIFYVTKLVIKNFPHINIYTFHHVWLKNIVGIYDIPNYEIINMSNEPYYFKEMDWNLQYSKLVISEEDNKYTYYYVMCYRLMGFFNNLINRGSLMYETYEIGSTNPHIDISSLQYVGKNPTTDSALIDCIKKRT